MMPMHIKKAGRFMQAPGFFYLTNFGVSRRWFQDTIIDKTLLYRSGCRGKLYLRQDREER